MTGTNQRQTVLKPVASNAPHNSGPGSDTSQPADDQPRSPIDTILLENPTFEQPEP